jgi:hypothetical protein
METIPGCPLGVSYSEIPRQYLPSFLEQLAEYVVQLGSLSFPAIGCLQYDKSTRVAKIVPPPGDDRVYTSSTKFVQDIRLQENEGLLKNEVHVIVPKKDRELAGWVLLRAVLGALKKECISGPFPLRHHDLHFMVDESYNITGIIDWSGVQTVPSRIIYGDSRIPILAQ